MEIRKVDDLAIDNLIMHSSRDFSWTRKLFFKNAIDWLASNGMKANTFKFLFTMISNERLQKQYIAIWHHSSIQTLC